jgi:hypothetical protein
MGRPLIEITEELCKKAETLAAQGLTVSEIASVLGVGERTLYEKQAKFPQFSQAITDGRAKGIATITNSLFQKAKSGDTPAIKYYLNNRSEEWSERKDLSVEQKEVDVDRIKTAMDTLIKAGIDPDDL